MYINVALVVYDNMKRINMDKMGQGSYSSSNGPMNRPRKLQVSCLYSLKLGMSRIQFSFLKVISDIYIYIFIHILI